MGFLKSPEIPLEGLIKIPLEGNFFRFPREEEKTRTRAAVGFLKSPEIPLEDRYFTPLHVADWSRVSPSCVCFISFGFLLATLCVWVWMVCSLHSVTTGSRDRANVPLIIIIIIVSCLRDSKCDNNDHIRFLI